MPQRPYDVHSWKFLAELARDARDGAGIVDLRNPYKPSRPISIVADTIIPTS